MKLFCKQVSINKAIQVEDIRTIAHEISQPDWEQVKMSFFDMDLSCVKFLICMRAFEDLRVKNPKFGLADQNAEEEFAAMRESVNVLCKSIECEEVEDKYLHELIRNGKSFLHNTSSFLGGLAAQEAVKLMMD